VSIDLAVWLAGVALEAAVTLVLLRTRIARLLPIFFVFSVWNVGTDLTSKMVQAHYGYASLQYFHFFMVEHWLDAVVQIAVLIELAWSVLRPYRKVLPRATIYAIAAVVLAVGAAVWPFTGIHGLNIPPDWVPLIRLERMTSVLRILFFMGLAGMSQVLAMGWRNRELQVATGLAFYSLLSLGASILHTYHASAVVFHTIDNALIGGYACVLLYWTVSFLQQEAPRHEFSPKMQDLLLTVAGSARAGRLAVEDLRKSKT
jgi:hypothetical protein